MRRLPVDAAGDSNVTFAPALKNLRPTPLVLALTLAFGLAGCSSIENLLGGDKVDYRSAASTQTKGLEVPPDLTQLARETRYQLPGGVVSAAATGGAASVSASATATVAPLAIGDMRVERAGSQRWLFVPLAPERLWPQLRGFWQEKGFTLASDSSETGVMETDWAENRAKLPQDFIPRASAIVFAPGLSVLLVAARFTSATAAWKRFTAAKPKTPPCGNRASPTQNSRPNS
jgi:uncharacterized lipoprotein